MKRLQTIARWATGAAALAFGLIGYAYMTLPDVRPLASSNPRTTAFMELRDAQATAAGKTPRREQRWVSYSRISPHLKRAVLVAEDASFWDHDGVDYNELQKSLELDWASGQFVRGASTITQQLAKNLYLSPSRNPLRKLRELIIARRLEAELKKARIFEIYLNVIEWGDGIYGAEAASRAYFGVPASALGPSDAALLAGAIINPRLLNPAHPTARLVRRQQIILSRMNVVVPPPEMPEQPDNQESTEPAERSQPAEPSKYEPSDADHPDGVPDSPEAVPLEPLPTRPIPGIESSPDVRRLR